MKNLSVELAPRHKRSLLLSNPVMTASGTFGYGMEYITLTPDAYQIVPGNNYKKFFLIVEPAATLLNDSGIWTFNDKRLIDHNYETILKVDDENIHGFQIDMLRRLSVHQAQTATALEKMSHESGLKEKERKARNSPYE